MGFRKIIAIILSISVVTGKIPVISAAETIPDGWLIWHSYTSYSETDSQLYLRDNEGKITEITGDFVNPMNGSFGITPDKAVFMAIDKNFDEWDIYLYDNDEKTVSNLTENSGFRNEDPKWLPDGKGVIFKRGYWNNNVSDFTYNLAILNLQNMEIKMLTDDFEEEAMPYISDDGKYLFYTRYTDGYGSIVQMDMDTNETRTIYSEKDVTAYYPVCKNGKLYFIKWYSAGNHHDQLMCYDGNSLYSLSVNSEIYDSSDPCPIDDNSIIYSSTANGSYSLYYFDGNESVPLNEINTDKNELGADFYSSEEYQKYLDSKNKTDINGDINSDGKFNIADGILLQKWLLDVPDTIIANPKAGDFNGDNVLNIPDLCMMKEALLKQKTSS